MSNLSKQSLSKQLPTSSTRVLLLGIWSHLSRRRRVQLGCLFLVMMASGVAELLSLGSVVPFLAMLSDPQMLWEQSLAQSVSSRLGFTEVNQLLPLVTFMFVAAVLFAAIIRLINLWLNGRLVAAIGSDLSCEAYRRTLYQPYCVHVKRNSAEVITTATSRIDLTVAALNSLLQLMTSAVVSLGLFTGLLLIDAPVSLASAVVFASAYCALAIFSRQKLRTNSHKIADASTMRLKALQEGLGAIRDVLLDGSQHIYIRTYRKTDRPQRKLQATNSFLSIFPRYALEALGMVSIALFGY